MTPNFSFFNFFLATEFMKINANYDIFVQEEPQIIDLCIVPFIGTVDSSSQYTLGNIFFHYIKYYELGTHLSVFNSSVGRVKDY